MNGISTGDLLARELRVGATQQGDLPELAREREDDNGSCWMRSGLQVFTAYPRYRVRADPTCSIRMVRRRDRAGPAIRVNESGTATARLSSLIQETAGFLASLRS